MPHSDDEIRALAEFYDNTDTSTLEGEEVEIERPAPDEIVYRSVGMRQADMDRLRGVAKRERIGASALMARWVLERLDGDSRSPRIVVSIEPCAAPSEALVREVVRAQRSRPGALA